MKRLLTGLIIVAVASVGPLLAQSDTVPPQLVGLSFAPPSVDVSLATQTVTFTLHITDNLSGTQAGRVTLISPSGVQSTGVTSFQPGILLDATFNVLVPIARFAEPGPWTISTIRLSDNAGNTVLLNTAALAAAGFPTTLTVIDANPDTQAPELSAVTFSPNSVDVSAADATITVDLSTTDDVSGVVMTLTNDQEFELRSPSGKQSRLVQFREFTRISGTAINGVWRATFKMARYSEPGIWKLQFLQLQDAARNLRFYTSATLAGFGSSSEVNVASSPADTTRPQLTSFSFTPTVINTSLGPQTVQMDLNMTDDLSGVSFDPDNRFLTTTYGSGFRSPSGAQQRVTNFSFSGTPPIVGTPLNGVWRFTVNFPQFSEEGTWKVNFFQLRDAVRNQLFYATPQAIAALGFPTDLTIIRPSLVPDGTISDPSAGGTVADATFGDRAELIVPGGVLSQPTTIAIDVLQSPLGIPLPTGFSSAETYFVNVQLTPTPAFPLPAPGITVGLPLRNSVIPGTGISLFRIDPTTGNLVPALDVSGNPAVGLIDPGGLKATFAGIASFSTIVGALPDVIPVAVDIKPGETPNVINTKSNGTIPAAIFSTPTLDLTQVDPATIHFAGAPVAANKQGKFLVSIADVNGDGLDDIIVHFETEDLVLGTSDVQGVVEGKTLDGRMFRGTDLVKVIK